MKTLWGMYVEELRQEGLNPYADEIIWERIKEDYNLFLKFDQEAMHYHG